MFDDELKDRVKEFRFCCTCLAITEIFELVCSILAETALADAKDEAKELEDKLAMSPV